MQPTAIDPDPAAVVRVLVIRHGQTAWNVERRVLGRTDIPLDEVGLAQARRLAAAVPRLDALYASPLSRAWETARALGAPRADEDLLEMDQGELDGLDGPTMLARHGPLLEAWGTAPDTVRLPGGETMLETQARGVRALARIAAAHRPGELVGVVTHQLLLASTLCAVLGEPLVRWRAYTHKNTAWTELAFSPAPRVVRLHVTDHLDEPPPRG